MKIVSHYGVHIADDGIAYLEQARGGTNAKGMAAKSPFRVKVSDPEILCNHLVTLNMQNPANRHLSAISSLLDDPLLRVMAPVPRSGMKMFYLDDPSDSYRAVLSTLSRLSSPIEPISIQADAISADQLLRDVSTTNIQPLVIRRCTKHHARILGKLAEISTFHPRTVILSGDNCAEWLDIPSVQSNLMSLDQEIMALLPWESIGAMILRSYMKGHWKNGWIDRLPRGGDLPREARPKPEKFGDLDQIISSGEGQRVEFKSTFQFCLKTNQKQQYVQDEIPTAVAGFLNAEGGTLLIGVDDSGNVLGIEHDLSITGRSWDALQRQIIQSIINVLGEDNIRRCRISLVPKDGKQIIRIMVERSLQAVFAKIKNERNEQFYCRVGNTTRMFGGAKMVKYIRERFPDKLSATE